jgi:CheY-like chemotaxis protein
MTVDDCTKLLEAGAKLASSIAWPLLFLIFFIFSGPTLQSVISNLSEFSFKGGGIEASAKIKQASEALTAAQANRANMNGGPSVDEATTASEVFKMVGEQVTPQLLRRAERSIVLWVDDVPSNNIYERQALEALGVRFVLADSTESALNLLKLQSFDAIISDMGREGDKRAGYTLLDALRAKGISTPFVIYAGSNKSEHKAEALKAGALGSTNQASELFKLVLSALKSRC